MQRRFHLLILIFIGSVLYISGFFRLNDIPHRIGVFGGDL